MKKLKQVTIYNGLYRNETISGVFDTNTSTITHNKRTGNKYCSILKDNKKMYIRITEATDVTFSQLPQKHSIAKTFTTPHLNFLPHEVVNDLNTNAEGEQTQALVDCYAYTTPDQAPIITPVVEEDENQILDRIKARFAILDRLVNGVCQRAIKALVVSGPPGVGKTFGIEQQLEKQALVNNAHYEFIKGTASALYIYQKLHEFADENSILVFDDCDSVFFDPVSLNLFKAALDSSVKRTITWGTESRILKERDIPNSFEFKGAIIFISNLKFDNVKSLALKEHLMAIESRCHYLDLTIDTPKDKLLRIKQVVRDSSMLSDYPFTDEVKSAIMTYIETHVTSLRELSLRTVKKIADLARYSETWEEIADITLNRTNIKH